MDSTSASAPHGATLAREHRDPRAELHRRAAGNGLITIPSLPVPIQQHTTQHSWSPYADNGGTCAAIAGKGFVIVAADTRLNGDFNIHTRHDLSKIKALTPATFLASSGMQADRLFLHEVLQHDVSWYTFNHSNRVPSTQALAQKLSTVLYGRRFFPLYTFNILVGLDDNGDGVCYSYDAVGTTEPLSYGTTGSASSFIEPLLDCAIMRGNMKGLGKASLTEEEALALLKHAFTGAAERDIYTGDSVEFYILTPAGVRRDTLPLRRD